MDGMKPPAYGSTTGAAVCPSPYDNKGFQSDAGFVKPPTAPPMEEPRHERMPEVNLVLLCDEDLREACLRFAKENCCYGSRFVRNATLAEIVNINIFHYQLSTFGEKRETMEKTEPFTGQYIDGPGNGPPPGPWDIPVGIPSMFKDSQATVEVPHTAYVKECFLCVGNCRIRCEKCSGNGGDSCWSCLGSGRSGARQCSSCGGTGRHRCWTCSGTGQVICTACNGRGSLRHFRMLIVTWRNHVESFVTDTSGLPNTFILAANGKDVYKEQNVKIFPLTTARDEAINKASRLLIEKHGNSFPQELIRQQSHTLRAVPFTKAKYFWKRKQGDFFVYGLERKVFFENYPQQCCCCTCM